jgi:hypothetical protein
MVEEARTEERTERIWPHLDSATGKVDGRDSLLPVGPNVIADDKSSVRPAHATWTR